MRDDRVYIDLPSRQEIEGTLKYLKNNKAAGAAVQRPYNFRRLYVLCVSNYIFSCSLLTSHNLVSLRW
jgi:hypothetical protein